jgi:hypothetical protein
VKIPAAESKTRRVAIAAADGTIERLRAELAAQTHIVLAAVHAMQSAVAAGRRLEAMPPRDAGTGDATAAATVYALAERRLAAFWQCRQADHLAQQIAGNDRLLGILAGDGLRGRKLARVLEAFNTAQLAPLCEAASWKAVVVDPDMTLTYGGRPYQLLSSSEQYRVRCEEMFGASAMVVMDAAMSWMPTRQIFAMLDGLPALVCLTLSQRSRCRSRRAGLGCGSWLSRGIAEPLSQAAQAA